MTDSERIEAAVELIRKKKLLDELFTADEVYQKMRNCSLGEIADEFAQFFNLIYELRDVLEGERRCRL